MPESDRIEGMSWCRHFDRAIDCRLVKIDRPPCIEERHGCAGCPESTYRVHRGYRLQALQNSAKGPESTYRVHRVPDH